MTHGEIRYNLELVPNPVVEVELRDDPENFLLARSIADVVLSTPSLIVEETTDYTRIPVDASASTRGFERAVPDTAIETIAVRQIRSQGQKDYEFTLFDSQNPGRVISFRRHEVTDGDLIPEYRIDQAGQANHVRRREGLSAYGANTIDESTVLEWLLAKFGLQQQKVGPKLGFSAIHDIAASSAKGLRIETLIAAKSLEKATLYAQNHRQHASRQSEAIVQRDHTDVWFSIDYPANSFDFAYNVSKRHVLSLNHGNAGDTMNSTMYAVEAESVSNPQAFVEVALHSYAKAHEQTSQLLQQAAQHLGISR